MTAGGINGAAFPGANSNIGTDSVAKSIQNQIANAKKQLQELASNKDMQPEEKMKKKQEIQQEINSLNQQLRQHMSEKRNEQRQKTQNTQNTQNTSQTDMQAMLSADSAMKQAKVQGSTAKGLEGKAGVLKVEIKLDAGRGGNAEKKREQLASVEQKALAAQAGQMSSLASANRKVKEAQEAAREETADKEEDKKDRVENDVGIGAAVDVKI